jgi:hypothetical protein
MLSDGLSEGEESHALVKRHAVHSLWLGFLL